MRANAAGLSFGLAFFFEWLDLEAVCFFDFAVLEALVVFFVCEGADSGMHKTTATANTHNLDRILTTLV